MPLKLNKTLLSQRPSLGNLWISALSLLLITFIFWWEGDLSANGQRVFEDHEYWRLLTTSLVHADIFHLGVNSILFTALALLLNTYFGLWIFPVLSLSMGAVINWFVLKTYPPEVFVVGISGVIYFMAAFWLVLYLFIERRLTLVRRLINSIALGLIFFFPHALEQRVSYLSHGLGFGLGILMGGFFFAFNRSSIRAHEIWVEELDPLLFFEEDI